MSRPYMKRAPSRVIAHRFRRPPPGTIPREGQPCVRGDVLFVVVKLGADDSGLTVTVAPHGAGRRARFTTMNLEAWRSLFEVPEPPG